RLQRLRNSSKGQLMESANTFCHHACSDYRPNCDGMWVPPTTIVRRDAEYDQKDFDVLLRMQDQHFWYRRRLRFVLAVVRHCMEDRNGPTKGAQAIDLGGGVGDWLRYLRINAPEMFAELALADPSLPALELAKDVIDGDVRRYHVDLMRLGWQDNWDVAFALDVLEHLPDDTNAVRQIAKALEPGGLLFVTMPALNFFWSYNDDLVGHQRRYCGQDLSRLAAAT